MFNIEIHVREKYQNREKFNIIHVTADLVSEVGYMRKILESGKRRNRNVSFIKQVVMIV